MTAQKYLDSRVVDIHRTWGRSVASELLFFSSSSSRYNIYPRLNLFTIYLFRSDYTIPLVALPTVDDSYPPQKKSFLMLKFMYDNFIDDFEWFFRADDDVYVDTDRLKHFLMTVNSSETFFIGQPGLGSKDEFGQLNLKESENFCMGGPGVIISRETLKRFAPHIQYCLKHLYSTHEDVEVGRCVQKFVNISCTWSFEMSSLFYHNFSGEVSLNNPFGTSTLMNAITFHPFKSPLSMVKFHKFYLQRKHRELRKEINSLHEDISEMQNFIYLETDELKDELNVFNVTKLLLGSHKMYPHQQQCLKSEDVFTWSFVNRYLYSNSNENPKRRIDGHLKRSIDTNIAEIVHSINDVSKRKGRYIDLKNLYYGYVKADPLEGVHYILDLFLIYRKYNGKRMTVPVRRHAYAIQNFAKIEIREMNVTDETRIVNIVVPLSGKLQPFKRFIQNFVRVHSEDPFVSLAIVLFPDTSEFQSELRETKLIIKKLMDIGMPLKLAQLGGHFARAAALQRGSSLFESDELLFFVDVDMHLNSEVLRTVRSNTIKGRQIYYPIVLSQYNPSLVPFPPNTNISVDTISGYWRQYGFGIVSLYNSDLQAAGGLNVAIQGWGQEDVDLYVRFVHSNISIFRSADKNLIHIYHDINCNPLFLSAAQYEMCVGTKQASLGDIDNLVNHVKHDILLHS
ncbi:chondroitin sulfate synthase 1-like protein [Leptotrombidium deliense]|uniref:Hexosyltransferase n=1 Tax=Leptotrombidium deliense TaxID=299467 RepID=A0A443STQ4_9ACAR|nr:chondroitin sulfate synthase 1-like protein [Leptotrombidium deliense]